MRIALLAIGIFLLLATVLVQAATSGVQNRPPVTYTECGARQRSLVSDTSLNLVFSNHTKGTVTIYWLDFKGERVWYNTLAPGDSYTQQTYVTHPWVIVDSQGRCLDQLVPNAAGTFDVPIRRR
ncbi:MAG TPA: hypothetical protein VGM90_13730 [Kofleriaceae bacterium]